MEKSLIIEEINRINFLMNFDINQGIENQKVYQVSEEYLFEDPKTQQQQKGQQQQKQGQQQLTPEQIQAAKQKIQASANKTAYAIFGELMKAFDMDGDKDLKDNDGTNEGAALAAIKKIQNKETLDALNKYIANWKQYPNLKTWLNAEMSDFDGEYGDIWNKLEKMGYAGANRNILLKVAGYTPAGLLIKGADKAIDALRGLTLEQIMEGFREIVGGAVGTVGTLILSFLGPVGAGINMLLYGILTAWDVVQKNKKSDKFSWFNLILDTLSLILSGIGLANTLKPVAGAKVVFAEAQGAAGFFEVLAQKFPKISKVITTIASKISSGGQIVTGWISKGVTWLVQKLPFLAKFGNMLKGAMNSLGNILGEIGNAIKGSVGKAVTKTIGTKLTQKGSQLLAYGTKYMNVMGKYTAHNIMKAISTKAGSEILKEVDSQIVTYIKDYLWKNGEKNVETLRPAICKMGETYCNTFDIVLNGIMITHTGKEFLEKGTKAVKSGKDLKNIKDVKGNLAKTQKIVKTAETGTKAVKKGYKGYEEVTPKAQTISKAITPTLTQQPQQITTSQNTQKRGIT